MKHTKKLLISAMMVAGIGANAQTWNGSSVSTTTSGNCNVEGGLLNLSMPGDPAFRNVNGSSSLYGLILNANCATGLWDGASIQLSGNNAANSGSARYFSFGTTGTSDYYGHMFLNCANTAGSFSANMGITKDGKVVIGNNLIYSYSSGSPVPANYHLSVQGDVQVRGGKIDMTMPGDPAFRNINGASSNYGVVINANCATGLWDGAAIQLCGNNAAASGQARYFSFGTTGTSEYYGHMFFNCASTAGGFSANMGITKDGKIVIGDNLINSYNTTTQAPGTYSLYVEKGILTEKLKVALKGDVTNWSDFVFNKGYDLKPLNEVEEYINENKHLPEIPSAEEVLKEGIDVASMDAKLLQKIEELTLYVIQQQKEIDKLKKKIK